jgi:hypothetical protein
MDICNYISTIKNNGTGVYKRQKRKSLHKQDHSIYYTGSGDLNPHIMGLPDELNSRVNS